MNIATTALQHARSVKRTTHTQRTNSLLITIAAFLVILFNQVLAAAVVQQQLLRQIAAKIRTPPTILYLCKGGKPIQSVVVIQKTTAKQQINYL